MTHAKKAKPQASLSHEQLHRCDLVIRQTFEKVTALFYKIHNLQVEVSELRAEQRATRAVLLALLGDPQTRHEAEAVLRDLKFNINKTL